MWHIMHVTQTVEPLQCDSGETQSTPSPLLTLVFAFLPSLLPSLLSPSLFSLPLFSFPFLVFLSFLFNWKQSWSLFQKETQHGWRWRGRDRHGQEDTSANIFKFLIYLTPVGKVQGLICSPSNPPPSTSHSLSSPLCLSLLFSFLSASVFWQPCTV